MKILKITLVSVLILATNSLAVADEGNDLHPYLSDALVISLGAFQPYQSLTLSVDGTIPVAGVSISGSKDFGIGDADTSPFAEVRWHFGEKWSLRLQYFEMNDSVTLPLGRDVPWGDLVFGSGSNVSFSDSFRATRVFFARRISLSEKSEFGVGGGIHWLSTKSVIAGDIVVNDGSNPFRSAFVKAQGPMPNLGVWYTYSPARKWAIHSRLDWLGADIGVFDGQIINAMLGVNYQLSEHIGLGLSYNHFELDVGVEDSGWRGELELRATGPSAYVSVYF